MKNLVLLLCFVLTSSFAFAQAGKTYVKTIDPQASQQIQLQFDYPYDVEQWDEENMRMLIDVTLKNGNDQILEQLMLAGRYKITKKKVGDAFQIDIPGLKKEVTIRGQKLEEEVTLKLKVPRYTLVESSNSDGVASVNIQRGLSKEMVAAGVVAKFDPNFYDFEVEMNINYGTGDVTPSAISTPATDKKARIAEIDAQIKALQAEKAKLQN